MVAYDCEFTVYCYYLVGFCPINKWYITVVTWALVVCLIYTPSALGPAALALWVYTYIRQTTRAHVTTIYCLKSLITI